MDGTGTEGHVGRLERNHTGLLGGRLGDVQNKDPEEGDNTIREMDSGNTMVDRVFAGNTSNDRGYVRTTVPAT